MMIIDNKFNITDKVYLKTDPDQLERIVTRLMVSPSNVSYELTSGTNTSWHYDFEITEDVNVLIKQ